ncbi:MAG: ATP-dependent nuclease [Methanoregula sp.]
MRLNQVKIKGFRNFKDSTINFSQKSLIIGPNDVGKTNLIYALRILLDKSLSEVDIEPKDSDFYAYEDTNEFSILIKFIDVTEEILRSRLGKQISDNNELFLGFRAIRNPDTQSIEHSFFAGSSINTLEDLDSGRFYLKVLNLKYISSIRNLSAYIKKEKKTLFKETKEKRSDEERESDDNKIIELKDNLDNINSLIPELAFIKNSTVVLNQELEKLSFRHSTHKIAFDVGTSDPSRMIDNVRLISKYNNKSVEIGGDGKNNQIFFALWAAKNEIQENNLIEITIYCIEEPEVHLHPHQQRKLAEYLSTLLKSQIVITSHSPQIVSEFSPNSIIRLYSENFETKVANNGCSEIIGDSFKKFGYRLSIIPAEAFFADVVFLVEGTSEILFYKALAESTNEEIDLDRQNISILSVEGISFKIYIQILNALEIKWVFRTDNDISKIPHQENKYQFAGIKRCLAIYKEFFNNSVPFNNLIKLKESLLSDFEGELPPKINIDAAKEFVDFFKDYDMFLSDKDLETDLLLSEIKPNLIDFFGTSDEEKIIAGMQRKKATFMHSFLKNHSDRLSTLHDNKIIAPLMRCKEIAEQIEIL